MRGRTWLVIGLGKSGVACCNVLAELGARVIVTDEKPVAELTARIAEAGAHATFVAPASLDAALAQVTSAVLSPGIPLTAAVVARVRAANVPIVGEIELAYRLCRAPIVAVTGTKGKSTVTALTGHLLAGAGKNVRVGGNIGNPLVSEVRGLGPNDWAVAEVSSFQLETVDRFKPRVAVLLNVAPDHLDRYASMEEYAAAKFRIFARQDESDAFVGNLDDARVAALRNETARPLRAKQSWFTLAANRDGATMYLANGTIFYAPATPAAPPVEVASLTEIPIAGRHNVGNAMAALSAAIAAGCEPRRLRTALASFRPMPHRLEPIAEIDGVLYVDDSKSTNPESTIAALRAYDRPIVLIAGGRAKGTPFAAMGTVVRERVKRLIAIGEAAGEVVACSGDTPSQRAGSMEEAVRAARDAAVAGDVVLLSPACASFDMFASAEDRGERFVRAVSALRERAGA